MSLATRIALTLLLLVALAAYPQARETITVSFVEVPVTVVDREGNPIRGLTQANFELSDDGKKREIQSFDAIDFASEVSMAEVAPQNPASRRNFLILFDLSFSSPLSLTRAQEAARDFITTSVVKRDLVAVGALDVDRGFRLLTSFTTDRNLMLAAVNDPKNFRALDPLQISGLLPAPITGGSSVEGGNKTGGMAAGLAEENLKDVARGAGRQDQEFLRQRIQRQVGMLTNVGKTLNTVSGRKHLVLLSEGFDPRLVQGRDAGFGSAEAVEEMTAVEKGEVWKVDSSARFGDATAMGFLDQMGKIFKRTDVVLHAIDIKGVRGSSDIRDGAGQSNQGLFLLANATGGTVFKNTNDMKSNFDKLARQHEVVYVLGFNAPTGSAGKLHDLKVKLVNVPGGRVQHRLGYVEAGKENELQRTLTTAEIVMNDIPQEDVAVAAIAAAFPVSPTNAQVPVILEISGPDLVKHAVKNVVNTEIFVYAFDQDGVVRDSLFQRLGLEVDKVGEKLKSGGVKWYGTLNLPAGKYAVKTLVRLPDADKKGYVRTDVYVPQTGAVTVLPPFFYEKPGSQQWVMVKGQSHAANAPYPFEVNGETFIPSARVRVDGQPRRFAVVVHNAAPADITWETNPSAKLVTQIASGKSTKLVFDLENPAAGTLNVTVKRKGSESGTVVTVPLVQ